MEKEDIIPKCDNCKDHSGNLTDGSLTEDDDVRQNDTISTKVSRISLQEGDAPSSNWCTKCKNSILKLEDTMPGISTIVPTFNLNRVVGRICRSKPIHIISHICFHFLTYLFQ